jgi:hypothetical protein
VGQALGSAVGIPGGRPGGSALGKPGGSTLGSAIGKAVGIARPEGNGGKGDDRPDGTASATAASAPPSAAPGPGRVTPEPPWGAFAGGARGGILGATAGVALIVATVGTAESCGAGVALVAFSGELQASTAPGTPKARTRSAWWSAGNRGRRVGRIGGSIVAQRGYRAMRTVTTMVLRYAGPVDEGNFLGLLIGAIGAVSIALHRRREILGPWRVGHSRLAEKKFAEAEACFRQTLGIAERRFGHDHWRTAIHVNALAQAVLGQRRMVEAADLTARALGIAERWNPAPHPHLSIVFVGAATLARDQGDLDRARNLLSRARLEAHAEPEIVAAIERTRFAVETKAGRPGDAADALARMPPEGIGEKGVSAVVKVALDRLNAGDPERAAGILQVVVAAVANARFLEFPEAFFRGMLGESLARAGRDAEARRELELAAHDYEALLGPMHPGVAPVWVALADVLSRTGDVAGATDACNRVLALGSASERTSAGPYRESAAPSDPLERERGRAREILQRVRRAS